MYHVQLISAGGAAQDPTGLPRGAFAIQVAADHARERRARFEQADAFTFTLPLGRGLR